MDARAEDAAAPLAKHAERRLGRRQGQKGGIATQRRGRASEQDGAALLGEHVGEHLLRGHERAGAARAEARLERLCGWCMYGRPEPKTGAP